MNSSQMQTFQQFLAAGFRGEYRPAIRLVSILGGPYRPIPEQVRRMQDILARSNGMSKVA